ncbi:MAG: hypothetical protein GMKNLPBB_02214 [Myxococcota bacterium]|nr:hypothetical protein [Myxococcota bacterium]
MKHHYRLWLMVFTVALAACSQSGKPPESGANAPAPTAATPSALQAAQAATPGASPFALKTSASPLQYHSATLAVVPVGDTPGAIAIHGGRSEERPYGPEAFAITPDGATLAIADSIKGRIFELKAPSWKANLLAEDESLKQADQLLMDQNNFLVHSGKLEKWLTTTITASTAGGPVKLAPWKDWLPGAIAKNAVSPLALMAELNLNGKLPLSNPETYAVSRVTNGKAEIGLYINQQEKPLEAIPVEAPENGDIGSVQLLFRDDSGDIYAHIELLNQGGGPIKVRRFVVRYHPGAKVRRAVVEIPMDVLTQPAHDLRVDAKGNIYAMLVRENGVEIRKWNAQ